MHLCSASACLSPLVLQGLAAGKEVAALGVREVPADFDLFAVRVRATTDDAWQARGLEVRGNCFPMELLPCASQDSVQLVAMRPCEPARQGLGEISGFLVFCIFILIVAAMVVLAFV